jgi:hypothetical protein
VTDFGQLGSRIIVYTAAAFVGAAVLWGGTLSGALGFGVPALGSAGLGAFVAVAAYFLYSRSSGAAMQELPLEVLAAVVPLVLTPVGSLVVGLVLYFLG